MQLIDRLEERHDAVKLLESVGEVKASYGGQWWLSIDGAMYALTLDAMDTLLNLLRIPIKYVKRCTDDDGIFLAEQSVNYWLEKYGDLSFLVESSALGPAVTQVFPGKKLYLPSVRVNDLIIDYLNGDVQVQSYVAEDDVFNAVYLTSETVKVDGIEYHLGVRVLFSDCFTVTPRFDGVLYSKSHGILLCWPTLRRKFRVASNTIPQVVDQIEDFLDLSIEGLRTSVVPALERFYDESPLLEGPKLTDADAFITRMCNDLRLAKKVKEELINNCTEYPNHFPVELVQRITAYTAKCEGETNVDLGMARDIQVALTKFIVTGSFK